MYFFFAVALIAAVALYLLDAAKGGKLNWSARQKAADVHNK